MRSSGMLVPRHRLIFARRFETALGTNRPVMRRNITEERRLFLNGLNIILHVGFFKETILLRT